MGARSALWSLAATGFTVVVLALWIALPHQRWLVGAGLAAVSLAGAVWWWWRVPRTTPREPEAAAAGMAQKPVAPAAPR
ncbi:MAG TPA: hypothetical protein VFB75_02505, partial [Burkholderiales bacterium]|nr:hypothetical protein [Burkholderiales bacterium]